MHPLRWVSIERSQHTCSQPCAQADESVPEPLARKVQPGIVDGAADNPEKAKRIPTKLQNAGFKRKLLDQGSKPANAAPLKIARKGMSENTWILIKREWTASIRASHDSEQHGYVRDSARHRSFRRELLHE